MITSDFKIADSREVDEVYPSLMAPEKVPQYLSQLKASVYLDDLHGDDVLITADTVVILDGHILGKPHSRDEAVEMLMKLQNRTHTVVTGVTLSTVNGWQSFSQTTEVDFDTLSHEEIEHYVDTYKPFDKAGAYGIQEWIGAAAIKGIRGSFYNVMGLPVHALYTALKDME